ncbi:MAG: DUF1963 domain-containing protein [Myxococcales bacterium]|nr:DUF1963 domain-containing protein [Myxococcales bacterium]
MTDLPTDPLLEILLRLLPATVDGGRVEVGAQPPLWCDEQGSLRLSLRIVYVEDEVIMDVRESEFSLGRLADQPLARWQAYIEGTLRAAATILRAQGGLDNCLPFDVFSFHAALDDPALVDADDFVAAFGDAERQAAWIEALEEGSWRELLEPCGLADHIAEVRALQRPSCRLQVAALAPDEDEDEPIIGESRIGGDPDLPSDFPWPSVAGEPLIFVAQFDLAALADLPAAAELPTAGLLSFFYSPCPPDDWHLEHPVAVLHFADPSALVRRPAPPRDRLRAFAIEPTEETQMPAMESMYAYEALLPAKQVQAAYEALGRGDGSSPPINDMALANLISSVDDSNFERPMFRLLGHPASIQGDPYLDIEMARAGWDGWQTGSDEAMAAHERSRSWRLLLQVDASVDGELLLNQDGGFFYFFMPADALAAHDWSRVRGCLQCH